MPGPKAEVLLLRGEQLLRREGGSGCQPVLNDRAEARAGEDAADQRPERDLQLFLPGAFGEEVGEAVPALADAVAVLLGRLDLGRWEGEVRRPVSRLRGAALPPLCQAAIFAPNSESLARPAAAAKTRATTLTIAGKCLVMRNQSENRGNSREARPAHWRAGPTLRSVSTISVAARLPVEETREATLSFRAST